jgi:transposase
MGNGCGVSRGDRNRNARLERLRVLVPAVNAIVGTDLADAKQMIVVTDHDSKVLARHGACSLAVSRSERAPRSAATGK